MPTLRETTLIALLFLQYFGFTRARGRERGGGVGFEPTTFIEHGNIAHQMAWFHRRFCLGPDTTILQKTPFSFDAAQWELLSSAYGATLIFGSREGYRKAS